MRFAGVSLFDATRLATVNPAAAVGLRERQGYLEPGQAADFTIFRLDPGGTVMVERAVLAA